MLTVRDAGQPHQLTLGHLCAAMALVAASLSLSQLLGSPAPAFVGLNLLLMAAFVYLLQFIEQRIVGQSRRAAVLLGFFTLGFLAVGEGLIGFALLFLSES